MVHGREGAEPSQVPRGPFGAPQLPAHEVLRALYRLPLLNDGTQENRALLAGSLFDIFHDDVLPPDLESSQVDHDTDPRSSNPDSPLPAIASDSSSDDDSGDDLDAADATGLRGSEGTSPRPQQDPVVSTTAGQSSLHTPPSSEPAAVASNNAGTNVSDEGPDAATSVLLEERDEGAEANGQTEADEIHPLEEGPGLKEIVEGPEESAEDDACSNQGVDADDGDDSNEEADVDEGDDPNESPDADEGDDPNESSDADEGDDSNQGSDADEEEHNDDSSESEGSGADEEVPNDESAPSEVSEADEEEHDDDSPESDESEADEESAPEPTVDTLPRTSATLPQGVPYLSQTPAGNATSTQVNPRLLPLTSTSTRVTLSEPVARQPAQAQLEITPKGIVRPALPRAPVKRPHLGSHDADDTPSKKQC